MKSKSFSVEEGFSECTFLNFLMLILCIPNSFVAERICIRKFDLDKIIHLSFNKMPVYPQILIEFDVLLIKNTF